MHQHKVFVTMMLLSALLAPTASHADPLYTVTLLPSFTPIDINNAGQIVGNVGIAPGVTHAVIYADGTFTDLGTLGGNYSAAAAINEAGDVTGGAVTASGEGHAFLYQDGVMHDIGAGIAPRAINAQGDVAGTKITIEGNTSGFVYRDGVVHDLGNLGTGTYGTATDINDHGDVVGESTTSGEPAHPPLHPFLFHDGEMIDIGTLDDEELNGAIGINNAGQIAGYSVVEGQSWHAFLYENGVMKDLGGFDDIAYLEVSDLNEHGTVVGTHTGDFTPFITIGDSLVDLNTLIDPSLGWRLNRAYAINDVGQILGSACREGVCGEVRLDLAGAVPEPAGALLLSAGLLALAWAQRRRLHQSQG